MGATFTVMTDHRSLQYFKTQPQLSNRQMHWKDVIANFDFDIVYIEGKTNIVADGLSRRSDHVDTSSSSVSTSSSSSLASNSIVVASPALVVPTRSSIVAPSTPALGDDIVVVAPIGVTSRTIGSHSS